MWGVGTGDVGEVLPDVRLDGSAAGIGGKIDTEGIGLRLGGRRWGAGGEVAQIDYAVVAETMILNGDAAGPDPVVVSTGILCPGGERGILLGAVGGHCGVVVRECSSSAGQGE